MPENRGKLPRKPNTPLRLAEITGADETEGIFFTEYLNALWSNLRMEARRSNRLKWSLVFCIAIILFILTIDNQQWANSIIVPIIGLTITKEQLLLLAPTILVFFHWTCILANDKMNKASNFVQAIYGEVLSEKLNELILIKFTHLKYTAPDQATYLSKSPSSVRRLIRTIKKIIPWVFLVFPLLLEIFLFVLIIYKYCLPISKLSLRSLIEIYLIIMNFGFVAVSLVLVLVFGIWSDKKQKPLEYYFKN